MMDALRHLSNHVLWTYFLDMDREVFFEAQAITPRETLASRNGGRGGKRKEGEAGKLEEEEVVKQRKEKESLRKKKERNT